MASPRRSTKPEPPPPCWRLSSAETPKFHTGPSPLSPAAFLLLGSAGGLVCSAQTALAEEGRHLPPAAPDSSEASGVDLEELVSAERKRIEELISSRGMQRGTYPPFTVAVKGQKVTVKFKIPPACDVSRLIVYLASHLGLKAEENNGGSDMLLRAWDSAAAWQITLNSPGKMKPEDDLCVWIFESLLGSEYREIEFIKKESFNNKELDALVNALKIAGGKDVKKPLGKSPQGHTSRRDNKYGSTHSLPLEKLVSDLEAMGVRVYGVDETKCVPTDSTISWDNLAGYEEQKREVEDTILLALKRPEVYDDIARGTRCKFETNRPRAVLFEGPPGTGKTSSARVIANQAGVPLLYVPLEIIMSKYYGESERLLGKVFSLANDLPDGALIFLDEVDSFAAARDSEMHEATRRILSILLRQMDGFEQEKRVVVIAATNRKEDLDPALISRFDSLICFDLPDQQTREKIAAQYAKHLKASEIVQFSTATDGMSGRDIRDVCQQAERHWAAKLIRGQVPEDLEGRNLPPIDEYLKCAEQRRHSLYPNTLEKSRKTSNHRRPLDLA